jgi:hypothetical protein
VIATARACADECSPEVKTQKSYVSMIEGAMLNIDGKLPVGDWNSLRTARPTIHSLGCASCYVGEMANGHFSYGMGFHRANVEYLLPISPLVCLHIQPDVQPVRH